MTHTPPLLSRRQATALLLAAPVAATGSLGAARPLSDALADQLRTALSALRMPFAPARFELIGLDQSTEGARIHVTAVVRMTWQPGVRQRRISAAGSAPEQALATLLGKIERTFSTAA